MFDNIQSYKKDLVSYDHLNLFLSDFVNNVEQENGKEEFSLKSSKWTGSDPIWIDEKHISLFFYEKGYMEEPTGKGTLKFKNGKWILTKDSI